MTESKVYLAIDLGATSGRVIAGGFDSESGKLALDVISRFPTKTLEENGSLRWDIGSLFDSIRSGLAKAAGEYGDRIQSIGVDSWAVDYGLLDENGELLGNPYHYRDSRTEGVPEAIREILPDETIYVETGIQFLFINTINQLYAETRDPEAKIEMAEHLLFIPDLINHWLSGYVGQERTVASTSQLLNPTTGAWSAKLLQALDLPQKLFLPVTEPGTVIGSLAPSIQRDTSLGSVSVTAVASHDTASAFVALPGCRRDFAIMSSGTWSLMGIELEQPELGESALRDGFSNEIGYGGSVRFLKNICGMWLVEECLRRWSEAGHFYDYDEVVGLARSHPGGRSFVDPDASVFAAPENMPEAIANYCRQTGQTVPETHADILRCLFESLALKYRHVFRKLENHARTPLKGLYMLGGGARNRLLNQMTADALGVPVATGPAEATAVGNVTVQMIASGELKGVEAARERVRESFPSEVFEPRNGGLFDSHASRFQALIDS